MTLSNEKRLSGFIIFILLICIMETLITKSNSFIKAPDLLSLGITIDLCILIPALYWFCIVKKKFASYLTMVPIIILFTVIARLILPSGYHRYVNYMLFVFPILELILLLYVVSKIREGVKYYKSIRKEKLYFYDTLIETISKFHTINPLIEAMATESSIWMYAITGFFRKENKKNTENSIFTCYKEQSYGLILGVLLFISLYIEIPVTHFFISRFNNTAAWIITVISIYSIVWIIGDYYAIKFNPIIMTKDTLYIRIGLRGRVNIPYESIQTATTVRILPKFDEKIVKLCTIGDPNYLIHLKEEKSIYSIFGIRKKARLIAITIDKKDEFHKELKSRITSNL